MGGESEVMFFVGEGRGGAIRWRLVALVVEMTRRKNEYLRKELIALVPHDGAHTHRRDGGWISEGQDLWVELSIYTFVFCLSCRNF